MTAPREDDRRTSSRAIWGLVDDRYDVAARSDDLTLDDARLLCRLADMGDAHAPLDGAVAALEVPGWGPVIARYYSNSRRDSAGRLTLVYDVVRPTEAALQAAGGNPLRLLPPLPASRTIEHAGSVAAPEPSADRDDAARIRTLLSEQAPEAADVLAAVLAGGTTLWVARGDQSPTIELAMLLLPPRLRRLFTFQSYTLRRSPHQPRLTVTDQHSGSLRDAQWSYVLPADRPHLPRPAVDAARSLLHLAHDAERLVRAHQAFEAVSGSGDDLLDGVVQLLRVAQRDELLERGDVAAALLATGDAGSDDEWSGLAAAVTKREPRDVGREVASVVARGGSDGWGPLARLTDALLARSGSDAAALPLLTEMALRVAELDAPDIPEAVDARTALSVVAARRGFADAFVTLLPRRPAPPVLERASRSVHDSHDARVWAIFEALASAAPRGVEDAPSLVRSALDALPLLRTQASHQRLAAHVIGMVREALRGASLERDLPHVAALGLLLEELLRTVAPTGELAGTLRRFLLGGTGTAAPAQIGRDAAHALMHAEPRGTASELTAWAAMLVARDDDDDGDRVDRAVAFLEAARDLPSLPAHLAPLLRALRARADAASSSPRWLALTALADHATRRELLVEVLVDSIRRCGAGGTVGDVAEVCLTLADAGVVLDNDSVNPVVGALTQLRGRLDPAAAAVRLRLVTAAIEQIADGPAAERIDSEVWWGEGAAIAGGRLWRAALALRLTERVRAARQLAVLQQSLHDHPDAARQLPRTLLEPISTLLRYTSSSVLGLLLGRDARATATTGAEERR